MTEPVKPDGQVPVGGHMIETKYTVKQAAWEAAGFDGNPTPQPLMEVDPRSGCMMLAFPHHWWQPDEVELAYVPVTISLGEVPPERDGYISTEGVVLRDPDFPDPIVWEK